MDTGSRLSIAAIIILLGLAMYFAIAETSFATVSRIRLKARLDKGDHRAKKALLVLDNFDKAITTILIGTNIVHITVAAIVTVLVTRKWGISAVTAGTLVTTAVVFFVGEMLPKSVAKKYSERFCLQTAASLRFFMVLFTPISAALTAIGHAASRLTKGDPEVSVTEDELYDIIEDMTDEGTLEPERGELMSSALQFADLTVETVLTARVDVAAINSEWEQEKVLSFIKEQRHSRLPVYEGSIDNVIGILYLNHFLKAMADDGRVDIRKLLMPPCYVYKTMKLPAVLNTLRKAKQHLAIVSDEYGGTLGVVSMEDVLEQIVGDIWDESDVVEHEVVQREKSEYELDGAMILSDFLELVGLNEDDVDAESNTVGGWTLEMFGSFPQEGDSFTYRNLTVTVLSMDGRRVERVLVKLAPSEADKD